MTGKRKNGGGGLGRPRTNVEISGRGPRAWVCHPASAYAAASESPRTTDACRQLSSQKDYSRWVDRRICAARLGLENFERMLH